MDTRYIWLFGGAIALTVLYEWQARRRIRRRFQDRMQLTPREFGAWYFQDPLEAELAAFLRKSLQDITFASFEGLKPEDRFKEDLRIDELDSLALVNLATEFEEKYKVGITIAELREVSTPKDFVRLAVKKIRESTAALPRR